MKDGSDLLKKQCIRLFIPSGLKRASKVIEIGSKFYDSLHTEVVIKYMKVSL